MKNCIMLWKNDAVDLAINNQRRVFSDAYNNEVLAESKIYINFFICVSSLFFADYNTYRQVITVDVKNDRVICNFWIKIPGLKYASKRFSWKAYLNPGIHIFRILFMLKNHTLISLHQKHYLPPVSPSHRHIDPRSV